MYAVIQLQLVVLIVFLSPQELAAMPLGVFLCQNATKQSVFAETATPFVCIMAHTKTRGGDSVTHTD